MLSTFLLFVPQPTGSSSHTTSPNRHPTTKQTHSLSPGDPTARDRQPPGHATMAPLQDTKYEDEKCVYDSQTPSSTDLSNDNTRAPTPLATSGPDENGITWKYLEFDTPFEEFGLPGTEADLPKAFKRLNNPFDWNKTKKFAICVLGSFSCLVAAYGASAYSSGVTQMMAEWHVKKIPLLCGITTFTTGFGIGPMVLAPISEVYGRRPMIMGAYLLFNSDSPPPSRGLSRSIFLTPT